jgi:hypothetical protein
MTVTSMVPARELTKLLDGRPAASVDVAEVATRFRTSTWIAQRALAVHAADATTEAAET